MDASDTTDRIAEVLGKLSPEQRQRFLEQFQALAKSAVETVLSQELKPKLEEVLKSFRDDTLQSFGLTDNIKGLLSLLGARTGDTREEVLRKALTLYGVALNARDQGQRLAILNEDDEIVRDIVGFEPAEVASQPAVR